METKTYFAGSLQAAMDVARRELGPDAMLVTSRQAPEEVRALGRLEVTFAWEGRAAEKPAVESRFRLADSGTRRAEEGLAGLDAIRQEILALRLAVKRQGAGRATTSAGEAKPEAEEVDEDAVRTLCETGMERDMARRIAMAGGGIPAELTARIPVAAFMPLQAGESRTLAFAGPPGRGKSTTLIKVALRYGLGERNPTRIYSAGAHGVGGAEQMARYAAILGVPFQAFESFESLHLALEGERWKGLILIDTPGAAAADHREMDGMAKFFGRRKEIEKHLVVRAEARSADMQCMLEKFAAIEPSRLLFTGVDEARGLGAAADTMIRSGIAATFLGTGPQIPDDLEEVNAAKLARSLWFANGLAARAA